MISEVHLRQVQDSDLPIFFEQQLDPTANHMAAFTARDPTDREAFRVHWTRIRGDASIILRTIVFADQVAGSVVSFEEHSGEREVGYWIGKEYWGKGIATEALALFLGELPTRPLFAHAARDNVASLRVLEKCGFTVFGYDRGFANARSGEIEEVILKLD